MNNKEINKRLDKIQDALNELRLLSFENNISKVTFTDKEKKQLHDIFWKDPKGGYTTKNPQFREDK